MTCAGRSTPYEPRSISCLGVGSRHDELNVCRRFRRPLPRSQSWRAALPDLAVLLGRLPWFVTSPASSVMQVAIVERSRGHLRADDRRCDRRVSRSISIVAERIVDGDRGNYSSCERPAGARLERSDIAPCHWADHVQHEDLRHWSILFRRAPTSWSGRCSTSPAVGLLMRSPEDPRLLTKQRSRIMQRSAEGLRFRVDVVGATCPDVVGMLVDHDDDSIAEAGRRRVAVGRGRVADLLGGRPGQRSRRIEACP